MTTTQRLAERGLLMVAIILSVGATTDAWSQQPQDVYVHLESPFGSGTEQIFVSTVGFALPPPASVTAKEIDSTNVPRATYYLRFLDFNNPGTDVPASSTTAPCTLGLSGWKITIGASAYGGSGEFTIKPVLDGSGNVKLAVKTTNGFNTSPSAMGNNMPGYQLSNIPGESPAKFYVSLAQPSGSCDNMTLQNYGSNPNDFLALLISMSPPQLPAAGNNGSGLTNAPDPPGGIGGNSLTVTSPLNFKCLKPSSCRLKEMEPTIFIKIVNPVRAPEPGVSQPPSVETLFDSVANWKITAYPQKMEIKATGNGVKVSVPKPYQIYQKTNAQGLLRIATPAGNGITPTEIRPRALTIEWKTGWWMFGTHHQVTVPCAGCRFSFGPIKKQ